MKLDQCKEFITANTNEDGSINYEGLNTKINELFDGIISTKKQTYKDEFMQEGVNNFLKEYEFENVESFKSSIANSKLSQTELEKQLNSVNSELAKTKEQFKDYDDIKKQLNIKGNEVAALGKGIGAENIKDVITLAATMVNEETDINQAIDKVIEKYPQFKGDDIGQVGRRKPNNPNPKPIKPRASKPWNTFNHN